MALVAVVVVVLVVLVVLVVVLVVVVVVVVVATVTPSIAQRRRRQTPAPHMVGDTAVLTAAVDGPVVVTVGAEQAAVVVDQFTPG